MEISAETLDRIADRFTDLAAHIHALQDILVHRGVMAEKEYGEVLEKWRALLSQEPSERAWKEALRERPSGGKR